MDHATFRDPPKSYREIPFWSWNDDLDPEELRRQIGLMDEAGWGGFFMHARLGLKTQYLGRPWFECVQACVDEARGRGMGAWLYDEDKWPSGFAGGLSVASEPSYRAAYLVCKVDNRPALIAERIATFAAREHAGQLVDIRSCDAPEFPDGESRVVQFYPQRMELGTRWFNDYAYLSLLNPDAVRAFIDSTHEVYARAVGADFGGAVPGLFTDEPCIFFCLGHAGATQPAIPWTDDFPAYFRDRNGYDLLPQLPSLFFNVGDYATVRFDYWRTVSGRYLESYTQQVYAWCEDHGLAFTGHYMSEDSLLRQIMWIGSAMPHYAYMHIPGVDKLDRNINQNYGTVLTFKQLDSVACQTGKRRVLCEHYAGSGQDFAHTGRKWLGDWDYVLGANLSNPHLSLYSMRGERKRDYPANLYYQQPWWPENKLIAGYFARLSYALSQGQRVADVLVIHPLGSAWTLYRPGAAGEVEALDRRLDALLMALLQNHRDFHLGDETLMAPGGAAEAAVVAGADGPRVQVGQMRYRAVIVPPGVTLAAATVRLLAEFAAAGGPIFALEPLPTLVDGRPAAGRVLPEAVRVVTHDTLMAALDESLPFDVRVPGRPAIWVHHRRAGGEGAPEDALDAYFLANTDPDAGGVATVQMRGGGSLEEWDPATGEARPLFATERAGVLETVLDFAPAGSHLLVRRAAGRAAAAPPVPAGRVAAEIPIPNEWRLALLGPNALTLDTVQVQIGEPGARAEAGWSAPLYILDAHALVARAGAGTPFSLRFRFDAAARPSGLLYLVMEDPESFRVTLNGQAIDTTHDAGFWTDISFRKLDVTGAVQAGRNEVIVSGVFGRATELESMYLVGDFGVEARRLGEENRYNGQRFDRYAPAFQLTAAPGGVSAPQGPAHDPGRGLAVDLTRAGLPFFAGRATLTTDIILPERVERAVLDIADLRAAVAHVRVNGAEAGTLVWPPHRVEIAGGLHAGRNQVEIELVGTLRNLLGPHHLKGGDMDSTGGGEFRHPIRWTDDYILAPFGFEGVTLRVVERP